MPARLTDEQLKNYQDGITEQKLFLDRDVEPLVTELLELREENERLKQELRIALDDDEEMYHAILDRTQGDL